MPSVYDKFFFSRCIRTAIFIQSAQQASSYCTDLRSEYLNAFCALFPQDQVRPRGHTSTTKTAHPTHMLLWQHKQLHTEPTNEHDVNAIEASHRAGKRGRLLYDIRTVLTKIVQTSMSARFARAVVPHGIARAPREATSGMY